MEVEELTIALGGAGAAGLESSDSRVEDSCSDFSACAARELEEIDLEIELEEEGESDDCETEWGIPLPI